MKKLVLLSLVIAIIVLIGCRRTDVREMTVDIPGLTPANQPKIVEALSKYSGIDKTSYRWDYTQKTLSLRYDSLHLAEANVRYAIDEKGIRVKFPEKTDERAGH